MEAGEPSRRPTASSRSPPPQSPPLLLPTPPLVRKSTFYETYRFTIHQQPTYNSNGCRRTRLTKARLALGDRAAADVALQREIEEFFRSQVHYARPERSHPERRSRRANDRNDSGAAVAGRESELSRAQTGLAGSRSESGTEERKRRLPQPPVGQPAYVMRGALRSSDSLSPEYMMRSKLGSSDCPRPEYTTGGALGSSDSSRNPGSSTSRVNQSTQTSPIEWPPYPLLSVLNNLRLVVEPSIFEDPRSEVALAPPPVVRPQHPLGSASSLTNRVNAALCTRVGSLGSQRSPGSSAIRNKALPPPPPVNWREHWMVNTFNRSRSSSPSNTPNYSTNRAEVPLPLALEAGFLQELSILEGHIVFWHTYLWFMWYTFLRAVWRQGVLRFWAANWRWILTVGIFWFSAWAVLEVRELVTVTEVEEDRWWGGVADGEM